MLNFRQLALSFADKSTFNKASSRALPIQNAFSDFVEELKFKLAQRSEQKLAAASRG